MKFIYFSSQTCPKQMGGKKTAKVAFGKGGTIHFNAPACELMELQAGDKVTLSQDEDEPENWYVFKDAEHGFELRSGYDGKGCLFNHAKLVIAFLEAIGKPLDKTLGFLMAGKPTTMKGDKSATKYWGILIR
jgi:hypothetical protein